ncbi:MULTISPECIES: terminase [unclassified Acinetobacter]|uniref:terminase n=1 Tax=unclassified Acinetobacter TaxID=196816 RepID=UPI00244A1402|nr:MULTISPECIES: terminase [unclassified Acinetobacter]MDH0030330.1 terminase [Acinetobacter sp. GD04021]MDH0885898.1 terminase [Acinetobacter sp. GD03873]MDH1082518.1 terminase [Acinetobacter sp. GD03983]MDH2189090.1 terminase [Acinetobacter sp. GD03645]MDH2202278.1 terminase [Acinetobacter sp. GD03647]
MNYALDEITPLIKEWTIKTRLPEIIAEMTRRYYYKAVTEQSEQSQQAEYEKCRRDPIHWFNHWVWTYDPRGMAFGLPANLPFVLRPKQVDLVDWLEEREDTQTGGVIEKSRDEGMSYVVLGFFLHRWLFVDGFAAGVGSRKEDLVDKKGDPKTLFYKFRDMLDKLPAWMKPKGFNRREHDNYLRIVNPVNGATLTGEAGDNIGRGGRTSMYLLDEWGFVANPEAADAAISQNTNVIIKGSTPNGIGNRFHQDRFSGRYSVFTMPWRLNPDKNWTAQCRGQVIYPWYEKQVITLDPVILAQEVDINYAASVEGVLIPNVWVQAAIDAHIKLRIEPTGDRIAGLDVADEGKDKNSLAGRHGILLNSLSTWSGRGDDIFYTTQKAMDHCIEGKYLTLYYDADGLGAGVRGDARVINEQQRSKGWDEVNVEPFRGSGAVNDPDGEIVEKRTNKDFFANLKAQSWWYLRLRFQNTYRALNGQEYDPDMLISLSSRDIDQNEMTQLVMELSQPTYTKNGVGKILVNKQPDGAISPNRADAVMICYCPLVSALDVWSKL